MTTDDKPSKIGRAVYVFLGYMLIGPFFAALAAAVLILVMPPLGMSGFLPPDLPPLGVAATGTFIWSAIPAAVSAIIVIAVLLKNQTFGWIAAVVAGVLGFAVAAIATDLPYRELFTALALLSGLISMAVRETLRGGSIID